MSIMENLETTVRGLTSSRSTERKKCAENLKESLSRNALGALLSKNTLRKDGFTWNNLFDHIDNFVLKETENFETSKTFYNVAGPLCASLLHLCVAGANKGRANIKCEKIISACLNVLQDARLTKAIGDAYLNLLYKHILTCDYYITLFTPTNWEDLLDVSLSMVTSKNSKLDDFTKWRLVLLVIKNGRRCCQLVIPLRDSLSSFKILIATNDKKILEVIIEIMILLLETLSPEYRLTMCELTESVLTSLLHFYEQNIDLKKKVSFFKLLEMMVTLHHPEGRYENDEGSLANNWNIWNKHLYSMLEIICLEIQFLQKPRKLNDIDFKQYEHFYSMCASVYYQIFNFNLMSEENKTESSSKRHRVNLNKHKRFFDVILELQNNQMPWLGVIHVFIKMYGRTIATSEYLMLLQVLDASISKNINNSDWNTFAEVVSLTVKNLMDRPNCEKKEDLLSLWNSCVRLSTSVNASHSPIHRIIRLLLKCSDIKYQYVQLLLKVYLEKGMPVTDSSVQTLNLILHKFFSKCSYLDIRTKCLTWLIQPQITCVNAANARELLLRLMLNENMQSSQLQQKVDQCDDLYNNIFHSIEKCILFSEFELIEENPTEMPNDTVLNETLETNTHVQEDILKYFRIATIDRIGLIKADNIELIEYVKFMKLLLAYVDAIVHYEVESRDEITKTQIYSLLKTALRLMYVDVIKTLKSNVQINTKIALLQHIQDIMVYEYHALLCAEIRQCVVVDLFQTINNIMNSEDTSDEMMDTDQCDKDEEEMTQSALKRNCLILLASYCRKMERYRDEILDIVLDQRVYNLDCPWDIECAFKCIELLIDDKVQATPIDSIFSLMLELCRCLFRDSKSTYKLLNILSRIVDRIWTNDNIKQNCFIMVKGYLDRCEKLYYPPHVAALVYKCAAKIIVLNRKTMSNTNLDIDSFMKALVDKTKGNIHCLRLYCIYTLKMLAPYLSLTEVDTYMSGLSDIFVINVSQNDELILKDESANRTSSLLHSFLALAQSNKALMRKVVTDLLKLYKEKSLDEQLVKKVLNIISHHVTKYNISTYLNNNILAVLNYWFLNRKSIDDLPISLFGTEDKDTFLKRHMRWLVSAETLWSKSANIYTSDLLKEVKTKFRMSDAQVFEECFSSIILLCLPYIVADKYEIEHSGIENLGMYQQLRANANKMFQLMRDILQNEKWSGLFVENVAELLLLTTTHLADPIEAKNMFRIKLPKYTETYYYSKNIYLAILKYFEELTDENIMMYLCEKQPVAIFRTLFRLWENVIQQNVFEYKVLSLHAFLVFVENIPLDCVSDAFVCNFVCNGLSQAIKDSREKQEVKIFVKALSVILPKYLPQKTNDIHVAVSKLLTILIIKKEEGFDEECSALINYLVVDMKDCLKSSEDVTDFMQSMSQSAVANGTCATYLQFSLKLRAHKLSLNCPSHETLLNMCSFLKNNKQYINNLCDELKDTGFSENCEESLMHQIIFALCNILKSNADKKTVIEACNCLSVIGTYNLKTLVTVSPSDSSQVLNLLPTAYFAVTAIKSLSDVLFDDGPGLANKVTKTLNCLLKFEDGVNALNREDITGVIKQILKPFETSDDIISADFRIDDTKFNSLRESQHFWLPNHIENEKHTLWLTRITGTLLNLFTSSSNYLGELHDVCITKARVCKDILPSLIGLLLHCAGKNHMQVFGEQINMFFKYIWDLSFDNKIENSGDSNDNNKMLQSLDYDHKMVIHHMLNIINFVRVQSTHYKIGYSRAGETFNYLNLEYDKVAWAATVADQNLVAIYYGELWAMAQNDRVPPSSPEATTALNDGRNVQRILRKCFVSIGEMDAIDGCGTAHLTIEEERRKHLINTGQYVDALLMHDIALSSDHNSFELQGGTLRSLLKSGLYHLALQHIKSLPESDHLNDIKYECLSTLGDWSDFVDTRELEEKSKDSNCNTQSIIKAFRYACLKDCLTLQTTPKFDGRLIPPLNRAKLAISRLCQDLNMENCQNVYKVVSKLHLFSDIEDYFAARTYELPIKLLLNEWQVDKLPAYCDFKHVEDLISQRSLILHHAATAHTNVLQDIISLQLRYAELSLANRRIQMAQRILAVVKKLQTSEEVALVESQISWARGHTDIALSLLRDIVTKQSTNDCVTATSLRQYGLWLAESKYDSPKDIINKYLKKSLSILNKSDDIKTRLKLYNDIAKFTDAEYKKVVSYMNSSVFQNKVECLKKMKNTVEVSQQTQEPMTTDEKISLNTNNKFMQLEKAEIDYTKAEKETFLHSAMRYYLLSLEQCDENNLSIFRVISLWLDNPSIELIDGERQLQDMLDAIPSHKFITVLPQLAPRLTNDNTTFAMNLRRIIKRCAKDHPHHTLPILFSLKNSDKDNCILNSSAALGGGRASSCPQEPRVVAAENLVRELANEHEKLSVIIAQMEKLCDATISFANYVVKTKEPKQKIPLAEKINKLGELNAIPIPTVTIPVREDCNYEYVETLVSFENYFELVGGINCPKKINCRSSNGSKRILLVKGRDDLRQDAVMQQVFNIVNTLLEKNSVTSRNKLLIRTYKVVPMSRRSGVLEWCVGTIPIGAYLVGDSGAHARYRPQDITCNAARKKLSICHETGKSNEDKLKVFKSILKVFKPVFHYFFTEHYLDPVTWYERRLAYTKSVATSSMVGYVMGLGDRHVQNILIDRESAEVIHIDFGFAFDQGKIQRTPETVPFRLTQDMIAGFGCCGVEGIFRRCCEKTMQLLRDNQETLLTILEVLLYDPLYTLTSKQNVQSTSRDTTMLMGGSDRHHLAERALLSVSSKLSGTEGGIAGGVAVPGQVARLIHTATDPANLCRLFPGWQPYL